MIIPSDYEPYVALSAALGIGLLIGLQREQHDDVEGGHGKLGGIRTFPIYSLAGALSMLLTKQLGPWVVLGTMALLTIPLFISYADDVRQGRDRGVTSESAFIATFLLGVMTTADGIFAVQSQRLLLATSIAVIITALLSMKRSLHELVSKISSNDVYATVKFLIAAVIVLPLLPDRAMGPLQVLNPRNIAWMIILIAGMGFVGYVANRVLGTGKGLGVTGLLGGLVSSTAVTLSMAGRSKREPGLSIGCALAVVLASTIMIGRVFALVAVISPVLIGRLAIPMGAMALAGIIAAGILFSKSRAAAGTSDGVKLGNPFELGSAVTFGVLMAVVLLISKAATRAMGSNGLYLASLLAGTTDVDAITVSAANLAKDQAVPVLAAVTAILLAIGANTIMKGGMAMTLGAPAFRRAVAASYLAVLVAGGAAVGILWLV